MSRWNGWKRTLLMVAACQLCPGITAAGDLTTPASVDLQLTSPTEDYFFWIDPDAGSDHYYPVLKGVQDILAIDRTGPWSIGNPQGYDHGYEMLGFAEPHFNGGDRNIFYWDCKDAGCNGGLAQNSGGRILMPAPKWILNSASCTRNTLGHELFHQISFSYLEDSGPDSLGNWVLEGHARALQDKIYDDFDTDPTADCTTTFLGQIETYLQDEHNVSLWDLSYNAALWWAYLMEQFGDIQDEPRYGADFLVTWYEESLLAGDGGNSFDVTDATIKLYDPGNGILSSFRRFVLANILKDMNLSAWSDAFQRAYSYVDEQDPGQDLYATVSFDDKLTISNAANEDFAVFGTNDFAVEYFKIDISGCQSGRVIRIGFEPLAQDPFFGNPINQLGAWGVVVGQSSDGSQSLATQSLSKFYKKLDEEWAVELFQPFSNPYETVYATTTGVNGIVLGFVRARCLPPPPNPYLPDVPLVNPLDPQTPGPPETFTYGEVCAVPTNPLPALDPTDYTVAVGGLPALVLGARINDDGHCLLVEYPPQSLPGAYDLTIGLGGGEVTVPGAVVHNQPAPNVLIAIDTSSTMLLPADNPKLDDVRAAVGAFVRQLLPTDPAAPRPRIGLVSLSGNDTEPNLDAFVAAPLLPATTGHLALLDTALMVDIMSGPGRFTSIGDAIQVAMNEFAANGDPTQSRHLVLIADGPENEGAFWVDIRDAAIASGINIHTIALGPLADQPLLYQIAKATGGRYWYVDVGATEADIVALAQGMAQFAANITDHLQIASHRQPLGPNANYSFEFDVPPSAAALLLPAVQAARESAGDGSTVIGTLTLKDPDGTTQYVVTFNDLLISSFQTGGSSAGGLPSGTWTAELATNANAGGEWILDVFVDREAPLLVKPGLARPETNAEPDPQFIPGDALRLQVAVADACAIRGACTAGSTHPSVVQFAMADGSVQKVDLKEMTIAAQSEQGGRTYTSGGIFTVIVTVSDGASASGGPDDGVTGQRGSYTLRYDIDIDYGDYTVSAIAHDAFAVLADSPRETDGDRDMLPDGFEDRMDCLDSAVDDAGGDQDADGLSSLDEFQRGTHPCMPDSDGGGELDGSEVAGGREPLRAADDAVGGIDFAVIDRDVTDAQPRDFLPNSLLLRYGGDSSIATVEVYRGTMASRALSKIVDLNHAGSRGEYLDTNLKVGTEYCYRLDPFDSKGNAGRPSRIFCGTALNRPARPWGSNFIAEGRPRRPNGPLEITLELYNKNPATSQMRLWSANIDTGWIPYAPLYSLTPPVQLSSGPYTLRVRARFRDVQGLESPVYSDDIVLYPPASLGNISGRVLLEGVGPRQGVLVWLDGLDNEPPAITAPDGTYLLTDLLPGAYDVKSEHPGWGDSLQITNVQANGTSTVPDLVLPLGSERLFADGFED